MNLEFVRIKSEKDEFFADAMKLYSVSFPLHEQRKSGAQKKVLKDCEYYFYVLLQGGVFAGAMLCWQSENFVYVEHFCILESLRGKGIGTAALEWLFSRGKTVILEIDPPCDAVSIRRKGFYEKAGFFENPYKHIHPPYREEYKGHELVIMSSGAKISEEKYSDFARYLTLRVMKYV